LRVVVSCRPLYTTKRPWNPGNATGEQGDAGAETERVLQTSDSMDLMASCDLCDDGVNLDDPTEPIDL
jgi:hypothetical protein